MKQRINDFGERFQSLHQRLIKLLEEIPEGKLFINPEVGKGLEETGSCGFLILRSAGAVEQVFGGITAGLWDDPFEWTLPEVLSTNEKIRNYLNEVENTRLRGFSSFRSDEDLEKLIRTPDRAKTLAELLQDVMTRAETYYASAMLASEFVRK